MLRVPQSVVAPEVEASHEVLERGAGQGLGRGIMGQDLGAALAKEVGEGLDLAVGAEEQEEMGAEEVLLAHQVQRQMETLAGEEPQGEQRLLGKPGGRGTLHQGTLGDVEGVGAVALALLAQAALTPMHPARVEQVET